MSEIDSEEVQPPPTEPGFFIELIDPTEGCIRGEGAGKSSQIRRLAQRLTEKGETVLLTREPGGSVGAELIRELILGGTGQFDPLAEALLFAAARADHVRKKIKPAIESGSIVLCDRFYDSTKAYQGAGSTVPAGVIAQLTQIAAGDSRPDITFILDIDPQIGIARAGRRNLASSVSADRFEIEGLEFHRRVREGFLAIAAAEPDRCVVIDASRDVEDVASQIWLALEAAKPRLLRNAPQIRLDPKTDALVDEFAQAMKAKLLASQVKYGCSDDWLVDDWEGECQAELAKHVQKGDPRDVANYAAFCWGRGWRASPAAQV